MGTLFIVPPNILRGQTVAILAPGPTLTAEQAAATSHLFTVAIGDAYRLAPYARVVYHTDARWWLHHWKDVSRHRGMKLTLDETAHSREICVIPCTGERGFDPDPGRVRHGNNSGYAALHAVAHATPARVLLFGYDMQSRGGSHYFGDHPRPLKNTDPATFPRWIRNFREVRDTYAKMGIDVVNCSPDSDLTAFRRAPLEEEVYA